MCMWMPTVTGAMTKVRNCCKASVSDGLNVVKTG